MSTHAGPPISSPARCRVQEFLGRSGSIWVASPASVLCFCITGVSGSLWPLFGPRPQLYHTAKPQVRPTQNNTSNVGRCWGYRTKGLKPKPDRPKNSRITRRTGKKKTITISPVWVLRRRSWTQAGCNSGSSPHWVHLEFQFRGDRGIIHKSNGRLCCIA